MQDVNEQMPILEQIVNDLLIEARTQGASAAEAGMVYQVGLDVNIRMGQVETIEYTRDRSLGITVYFGTCKGSASTTDLSPSAIRDTVDAACKIAKHSQNDPYAGLADAALMAKNPIDLDLYHPSNLEPEAAINIALQCETAAFDQDPRIVNSEGASFNTSNAVHVYGNSHGFIGGYSGSQHSISCAVISQEDESMQQDHWWISKCDFADLEAPEIVGRKAAQRALARLGARQIKTCVAPVVFDSEVAASLLHHLIHAINGHSLYRKSTFLLNKLGQQIFPKFVHIHEIPHIPKTAGSAPFDAEGVTTSHKDFVANGILQNYVLDSYSARKLGMQTTGNAGGVHNLTLDSGTLNDAQLRQALYTGLWVTDLLGQGVNLTTGDYSRGAVGFWIEQGAIAYPVEEITIASNLQDIFMGLQAISSDIDTRKNTRTGAWLMAPMTIAGA
jgi:PmbA protein